MTVQHAFGSTTVERAPERIVALGATDADVVLALGEMPVGIRSPHNFPRGVGAWAEDELGSATPAVMGREINYEAIAALRPDLILDVVGGAGQEQYDTLARIAPTVSLPAGAKPYAPAWQETTMLIATALGLEAKGVELVEQAEAYLADVRAAHPGFDGRTVTYIDAYGAEAFVGGPDATAVQMMGELGFQPVPYVRDLQTDETQVLLSNELLGQIDADVLLIYAFGNTEEQASEAIAALPDDTGQFVDREVRRGHRPARRHPRRRPAGAGQPRSGALAGMLAGSVAQRCVHHPICPLVLVPAGRGSRMMEP